MLAQGVRRLDELLEHGVELALVALLRGNRGPQRGDHRTLAVQQVHGVVGLGLKLLALHVLGARIGCLPAAKVSHEVNHIGAKQRVQKPFQHEACHQQFKAVVLVEEFLHGAWLFIFQDFNLLSFSIAENVACSTKYDEDKVWKCLEMAGLSERVKKMPEKINQCVTKLYDENGIDLSGGEAQKLAIARALYKDAPFVILDEPTAALDPKSESEIYARFDEMSGGRTAVYISHRMSSCRFCDRIAVFKDGTVVEEGTHEELLTNGSEYSQLWNAQAQHYKES